MGVQPDYDGVVIEPCVPKSWTNFSMSRRFRGNSLNISVKNPSGVQKGVKSVTVNGELMAGNKIPLNKIKAENTVEVIMG